MGAHILFVESGEDVLIPEVEGSGDLSQYSIGRLGRLYTLCAHRQFVGHNDSQILLLSALLQVDTIHLIAVLGVTRAKMYYLALRHVELHTPKVGPGHQVVEHQLQSVSVTISSYIDTNFGVVSKLADKVSRGCLQVQIIYEDDEEQRAQHAPLGNSR